MGVKKIMRVALVSVAVFGLVGCKTTEANYQRAYEVAKAKKDAAYTEEELAAAAAERNITMFNGDTISMRGEFLRPVKEGDGQSVIRRYTVVTGMFRQQFNANDMRKRLVAGGFPGAMLATDRSNRYYVGAVSTESLDSAVAVMKRVEQDSPVGMSEGYPVILRKGGN